MYVAVIT